MQDSLLFLKIEIFKITSQDYVNTFIKYIIKYLLDIFFIKHEGQRELGHKEP